MLIYLLFLYTERRKMDFKTCHLLFIGEVKLSLMSSWESFVLATHTHQECLLPSGQTNLALGHIGATQHCSTLSILHQARFSWSAYPLKQSWLVVFIVLLSFIVYPLQISGSCLISRLQPVHHKVASGHRCSFNLSQKRGRTAVVSWLVFKGWRRKKGHFV